MSDNIYLGNPLLKKANTSMEFTQEQILEFMRCKDDPVYFAKNYVRIVTLDHGLMPFDLYPFQEKLINNFHENRFNICKMPRQTGKSTTVVSYLLHYAVFNDNVNIGILANKQQPQENFWIVFKRHMKIFPSGCNKVSFPGTKVH